MENNVEKIKSVIIRKPDLDTVLTAILLKIEKYPLEVINGTVSEEIIYDKSVCCIECGGSGLIKYNNFDHHNLESDLPCSAKQAFDLMQIKNNYIEKLVNYVSILDLTPYKMPRINGVHLSYIFSGMMMYFSGNVKRQFHEGIEILNKFIKNKIDPFKPVTIVETEWSNYILKKRENARQFNIALKDAKYGCTKQNRKYVIFRFNGVGGSYYFYKNKKCDIVILYNPEIKKTCIMTQKISLKNLLKLIDKYANNWGGRDTVICSAEGDKSTDIRLIEKLIIENL